MKQFLPVLTLALLGLTMSACDSGLTESATPVADAEAALGDVTLSKADKAFVCHVGNELPEYDPTCDPLLETCGDAGKIDLIHVAVNAAAQHLANPSHCYDSTCDYAPEGDTGAADAKEDTDGNFVDEACEPLIECPCFDETDLVGAGTCGSGNEAGVGARKTIGATTYQANVPAPNGPSCRVNTTVTATSTEVAEYCVQLILDACPA